MVYQSPPGARDLLPLDVAQKSWIEERLYQVFHQWGYHRIITSTVERLDTLMAGGAIARAKVIQLQDTQEELGLRPEVTASIARAAATRMGRVTDPKRLYYSANVFERSPKGQYGQQQEFYQAGVELLGAGGTPGDSEILLLLADCLQSLELNPEQWVLAIGEAGLTQSLLSAFPQEWRNSVRTAIATLDYITLTQLPLSPDLQQRALSLFDLRGKPAEVFPKLAQIPLTPTEQQRLENLKTLIDLLQNSRPHQPPLPLLLDLSLIRTFDYYSGIVFEVVSRQRTQLSILGQGGRYDHLVGVYHPQQKSLPGIGFCLNIEALQAVLQQRDNLPQKIPASDWLIVPESPQAWGATFAYAQTLRSQTPQIRVQVDLIARENPEAVRSYAQMRRIPQIAWINAQGEARIEPLNQKHTQVCAQSIDPKAR